MLISLYGSFARRGRKRHNKNDNEEVEGGINYPHGAEKDGKARALDPLYSYSVSIGTFERLEICPGGVLDI